MRLIRDIEAAVCASSSSQVRLTATGVGACTTYATVLMLFVAQNV